ncbi:MAG: NlpC/P60 family protein [Nitrospirota bacterium]|nr:NlpC/P60 family protein [Nitrospirota bacterium]
MIKRLPSLYGFLIALGLLLQGQPAFAQPAQNGMGIISVPLANVRSEPEPKAPIVTQVLLADEVRILEKLDYRYRIAIPNQGDREGWIHQEAVLLPRDNGKTFFASDRQRIVIAAPKTPALIIDRTGNHVISLYAGTRLPVAAKTAEGYKVQFPDHTLAIIPEADVMPVKPRNPVFEDIAPAEIARTAQKFKGVRYLSGGITAQGIDTRGLIYTVYRVHGIDLTMDPDALRSKLTRVPKKELEPGDVLAFYGEGLGLYVANGQFLHVPRKTTVQTGGVHDRRYAKALQFGLRVLGPDPAQKKLPAEMTADEILVAQSYAAGMPLPRRIVFWAERFIGTPYDPDPLGLYVRSNRIVTDEMADCMYLTFRAVELARSATPGEAVEQALDLRFRTKGTLRDGIVENYNERFDYGEDMVWSGKWGRNITADLGAVRTIPGSRGKETVDMLPKAALATRTLQKQLQDGDVIYWVKDPKKRVVEEIVAHLSFVHVKNNKAYLIHASGSKDSATRKGGGAVKEVPFSDYVRDMKFVGALVTRLEQ